MTSETKTLYHKHDVTFKQMLEFVQRVSINRSVMIRVTCNQLNLKITTQNKFIETLKLIVQIVRFLLSTTIAIAVCGVLVV